MGRLRERGKQARSIVRAMSALRSFFNFLLMDGKIKVSPLEDIEVPRFKAPIPDVLSETEILELIRMPDGGRTSLRDRTILELLYATGLRVSELTKLNKSDVNLNGGFVITMGKRSKERVVPLGTYSRDAIKLYLETEQPKGQYLFPNKRNGTLTRQAIWKIISKYSAQMERRVTYLLTRYVIPSRRTFCRAALICVPFRSFSDMKIFRRRRFTPMLTARDSKKSTRSIIRGINESHHVPRKRRFRFSLFHDRGKEALS